MASHSSNVPVSSALSESFRQMLTTGSKRFIKAQVKSQPMEMVETGSQAPKGTFTEDFGLVPPVLEPKVPAFILYRTDTQGTVGFEFLLLSYVPDTCKATEKMLYSSSKGTLRTQLGSSNFVDTIHGTIPDDFSLKGYNAHLTHQTSDAPLTETEMMKKEQRSQHSDFNMGTQYVHGVSFPVTDAALDKLQKLKNGAITYVQLKIDEKAEKIDLATSSNIGLGDIGSVFPPNEARFHFFAYKHEYEGQSLTSVLFVYSCSNGTPVKQRMLYSTTKSAATEAAAGLGIDIARKYEVNTPEELAEQTIFDDIHPPKVEEKKAFAKPSKPGKGGRKLVTK